MAKVRVLQKSFINNQIVEEGEIVDYDGELGPNLEPLDGKKKGAAPKAAPAVTDGNQGMGPLV